MGSPSEFDVSQEPAVISKVADVDMPTIEFDTMMNIAGVTNVKKDEVKITLTLKEHPDSNKPSVYGTETGEGSVAGKIMYAFKHNHTLAISGISIQPLAKGGGDD